MNHIDSSLQRLFRAAARARQELPTEAPFGFEVRVLNAWRAGLADDYAVVLAPLFRRAFVCACAVIIVSAALTLGSWRESAPNELSTVDSVMQLSLMQQ